MKKDEFIHDRVRAAEAAFTKRSKLRVYKASFGAISDGAGSKKRNR